MLAPTPDSQTRRCHREGPPWIGNVRRRDDATRANDSGVAGNYLRRRLPQPTSLVKLELTQGISFTVPPATVTTLHLTAYLELMRKVPVRERDLLMPIRVAWEEPRIWNHVPVD